jgi:hypothetical protein
MIESHEFQDDRVKLTAHSDEYLYFNCEGGLAFFTKSDIVAMAKAVKLNAHDIDCLEHKALQLDSDILDEMHYDECVNLRAEIALLNQRLLNKKVN